MSEGSFDMYAGVLQGGDPPLYVAVSISDLKKVPLEKVLAQTSYMNLTGWFPRKLGIRMHLAHSTKSGTKSKERATTVRH